MHGFVSGYRPEGVEVDVDGQEPHHERESRQFGFEADGHEDDEGHAHHVLKNLDDKREVIKCL